MKKKQFKETIKDKEFQVLRDEYKIPFSCYACNKLMMNWDDKFFFRYGVCANCTINYIEGRELEESLLKDRKKLLIYVKNAIEKNKNRKPS